MSGRPEGCCACRPVSAGGTDQRAAWLSFQPAMLDYLTGLKFQYIVDVKELRIQSASSFRAAR
jgi:hypothetical protein